MTTDETSEPTQGDDDQADAAVDDKSEASGATGPATEPHAGSEADAESGDDAKADAATQNDSTKPGGDVELNAGGNGDGSDSGADDSGSDGVSDSDAKSGDDGESDDDSEEPDGGESDEPTQKRLDDLQENIDSVRVRVDDEVGETATHVPETDTDRKVVDRGEVGEVDDTIAPPG